MHGSMERGWKVSFNIPCFIKNVRMKLLQVEKFIFNFIFIFYRYYEATIDGINEDGVVNLTFNEYKNTDVTMLSQLKSVAKRPASDWAEQKAKLVFLS